MHNDRYLVLDLTDICREMVQREKFAILLSQFPCGASFFHGNFQKVFSLEGIFFPKEFPESSAGGKR